ncbi:hypothetical protein Tco_1582101 [Tanacetum coccineum]
MTYPHSKRSFVPQAVLTRTGKVNTVGASINTVIRPINTATSTLIVNHPRPKSNAYKRGYSQSSRPFNRYYANKNNIINTNVNTARVKNTTARDRAVVSENKGIWANAVKASGRHEHEPKFDFDAANVPVTTAGAEISTASPEVKLSALSTAKPKVSTAHKLQLPVLTR